MPTWPEHFHFNVIPWEGSTLDDENADGAVDRIYEMFQTMLASSMKLLERAGNFRWHLHSGMQSLPDIGTCFTDRKRQSACGSMVLSAQLFPCDVIGFRFVSSMATLGHRGLHAFAGVRRSGWQASSLCPALAGAFVIGRFALFAYLFWRQPVTACLMQ